MYVNLELVELEALQPGVVMSITHFTTEFHTLRYGVENTG
jgi:hypothetical protein